MIEPITHISSDKGGNRQWRVTTQPTVEPITVDELKTFARIDGTTEDTLIEGFIKATRQAAELYLGMALLRQTITMVMDEWPKVVLELPQPPLISVTSISTIDEDDTATTYSSSSYYVDTYAQPGRIVIKDGASPPTNTDRYTAGFRIVYTAGFGTTASTVPQPIIEGLKLWTTAVYENRALTPGPPPEALNLFNLYRKVKY